MRIALVWWDSIGLVYVNGGEVANRSKSEHCRQLRGSGSKSKQIQADPSKSKQIEAPQTAVPKRGPSSYNCDFCIQKSANERDKAREEKRVTGIGSAECACDVKEGKRKKECERERAETRECLNVRATVNAATGAGTGQAVVVE